MVLKLQLIVIILLLLLISSSLVLAQSVADWNKKGMDLYDQGKYEEAIKCYDKALQIDPNDARVWIIKGIILFSQNKYEEAIKCFDKAIGINPKYAEAWFGKGLALDAQGKYEEAIKCYDKALEINPKYAEAWHNKGGILYNQGKYEEAIKCYDKALEINPKYAEAWHNKGLALYNQGKFEEAIKCYDKALEFNPKYVDVWNDKGFILYNQGKYEEAIKCYDKALEIDPNYTKALNNKKLALKNVEPNQKNKGSSQGNDKITESNSLKIKDLKTLVINIASAATDSKYKGNVFLKDGILYTYLEDLKQHMLFNYEYAEKKLKIHLSSSTIEYSNSIIRDGSDLYVPLVTFCQSLGFNSSYNESTNTLEIKKSLALNMSTLQDSQSSDYLIVPKIRVGPVCIFDLEQKVVSMLGEPTSKDKDAEGFTYHYDKYSLSIVFDTTHTVRMIIIQSSDFQDANGIGIGSSISTTAYYYKGHLLDSTYMCFDAGILFDSDSNCRIKRIAVFDPGYYDSITRYNR